MTKFEWVSNQQRDTIASNIGHYDLMSYFAVAENESIGRTRYNLMEKMLAQRSAMDAPDYLALCVRQYGQFLALMKRHRGVMLVPTLAIDLMCVPRSGHPSIVSRYYD